MGFLDKAKQLKEQAESQLNSATTSVNAGQNRKVADAWLMELGQWVYADRLGRDPRAAAETDVRIQQLQQWEQQNGQEIPRPMATPGTGGGAPVAPPSGEDPGPMPSPGDSLGEVPAPPSSEPLTVPMPATGSPRTARHAAPAASSPSRTSTSIRDCAVPAASTTRRPRRVVAIGFEAVARSPSERAGRARARATRSTAGSPSSSSRPTSATRTR